MEGREHLGDEDYEEDMDAMQEMDYNNDGGEEEEE